MMNPFTWDVEVVKAWGPIVIGLVTVLVTLFLQSRQNARQNHLTFEALKNARESQELQSRQNARQNDLTFEALQNARESQERDEIHRQLTKFYGPLRELRIQSRILYEKFAVDVRTQCKKDKRPFRTLPYLATYGTKSLTPCDRDLLGQIVAIGRQCLKLIECEAGVVDKPALRDLLGQWGAHIRLLEMAAKDKLEGSGVVYDDIVYPREIDGALESAILRLEARLDRLLARGTPHFSEGPKGSVEPKSTSLGYYDRYEAIYREHTAHIRLDHLWDEFAIRLPRGGRILDAGCGVGRDTRHFIEAGYIVVSIDASWKMVLRCREYPHAFCLWMNFSEMELHEEFDGVWSCASLVHAPPSEAKVFVDRFERATKPGGIILISVKYDSLETSSDEYGRVFYNYDENRVRSLYECNCHLTLDAIWVSFSTSSRSASELRWLNLVLKKRHSVNC